jgi:phosphoenolpyruvate-protein phosphotransferase (PTS system enzyme I)
MAPTTACFSVQGLAVSRGIAIGRAVCVTATRTRVAHYKIAQHQIAAEIERVAKARQTVVDELVRLQHDLLHENTTETHAPQELIALLDVHLMLLQDESLADAVRRWIEERQYNAEWALTAQMEVIARQFDEMEDAYLRERKADLEQVVDKVLRALTGAASPIAAPVRRPSFQGELLADDVNVPLVLIAHDLSPADMLQFKKDVFVGFATDVGGKTSHTAIVARSMDIPAVVGARVASQLVQQDDWVIIDGDAGVLVVNPSPIILAEYGFRQRQAEVERERLARLINTPAITLDGETIELLANIETPEDAAAARSAGAQGVGLFRTEFLFMDRGGKLPDEEEQTAAYTKAVQAMQGLPMTIRTVDVGADKPLERTAKIETHLNPALGQRAIRWSLADPAMFLTQLRAVLRASAHGPVHLLIPMVASARELRQTQNLLDRARQQLDKRGVAHGQILLGAMIEIPAAVIALDTLLPEVDFVSIGTNDLIQYTLAIDRADEAVAALYEPMHPAVLRLIAQTILQTLAAGKQVSVCGELAGDPTATALLLGMGLRSFSMHPAQLLRIKQEILRADTRRLSPWARRAIAAPEPKLAMLEKA